MDLKEIDLNKLQDYAFRPYEIVPMASNQKFINIKCLDNESIVPTVKAIPLDRIKQASEEIGKCSCSLACFNKDLFDEDKRVVDLDDVLMILGKLMAESET